MRLTPLHGPSWGMREKTCPKHALPGLARSSAPWSLLRQPPSGCVPRRQLSIRLQGAIARLPIACLPFHSIWWQSRSCFQLASGREGVSLSQWSDAEPSAAQVMGAPAGPPTGRPPPQTTTATPFTKHLLCARLGAKPSPVTPLHEEGCN